MKTKTITVLLALLTAVAIVFAACTAGQPPAKEVAAEQSMTTELVTIEAPPEEVISFTVTDAAGNVLSLIPIYNADAVSIVAGYAESATDAAGNQLTPQQLSAIGSIIGVTAKDNTLTADTDADGNPLIIESYADSEGLLIAMKDVKDLNQNADTEEFLKLNLATDANGILRYMVEYTAVAVVSKKEGEATVVLDGQKQQVSAVDASDTAVAQKMQQDKQQNEKQQEENRQQVSLISATSETDSSVADTGMTTAVGPASTTVPGGNAPSTTVQGTTGASTTAQSGETPSATAPTGDNTPTSPSQPSGSDTDSTEVPTPSNAPTQPSPSDTGSGNQPGNGGDNSSGSGGEKPSDTGGNTPSDTDSGNQSGNENPPAEEEDTQPSTETTSAAPEEEPKLGIVLLPNRTAKSDAPGVSVTTGAVTITQPGDYEITSETDVWHGQIIIRLPNTEKAEVAFRNVAIQNDTTNIIQIIDSSIDEDRSFLEAESGLDEYASDYVEMLSEYDMAPNVQLSFPEGTSSSFTTTVNSHTGVLYNESKLIIKGHGNATFSSVRNPNNCICSTKSIKIRNVHLSLNTPQSESTSVLDKATGSAKGIFSYSRITVESGTLTVRTNGDGIRCQKLDMLDGSVDIKSSACDGIDADDMIVIGGGNIRVTAFEKYAYKVRRINNTDKGYVKGRARPDKGDTFEINGGTVIGESKRISTVQPSSAQASLSCRIVKPSAGTNAALLETKTPDYISIEGVKTSENKCTKFLYSAASLKAGKLYSVSAGGNTTQMTAADWNSTAGTARVISVQ